MRSRDLGKRYGWGVHADVYGRVAIFGVDSPEYARLASGINLEGRPVKVFTAMRSRQA